MLYQSFRIYISLGVILFAFTFANANNSLENNRNFNSIDSTYNSTTDTTSQIDSISIISEGKIRKVVKRDFNQHQQVLVGSLIMTFVAVILVTTQNWNP